MKNLLKYDDVKVFKYDNVILAVIYTIGHIFIAMTCNRIITGASLNMAAADAFIEPIIYGFWFYFLLVFLKDIVRSRVAPPFFYTLSTFFLIFLIVYLHITYYLHILRRS